MQYIDITTNLLRKSEGHHFFLIFRGTETVTMLYSQ